MKKHRLHIGSLNKRLAIRTNTPTTDAGGGFSEAPSTSSTEWGEIEPLRGVERQRAMAVDASITHKITMRYISTLTEKTDILYDSRTFRLGPVISIDEEDRVMEVFAKEVV